MTSNQQCKELVGRGTIQHACRLTVNHEGPCVAPENGPSQIARGRWEAEQKMAVRPSATPEAVPSEVAPSSEGANSVRYEPRHDFRGVAMDFLNESFGELPTSLRAWVLGAECQMVLVDMWKTLRESGADTVTLDMATIERVLPESLRR